MGANMGYAQDYQNAQRAYIEGNYADAAPIIDRLAENYPHDPSVCLLRAHIYCGLRQYAIAHEQYQAVIHLTNDVEYVNYARDGLAYVEQFEPADPVAAADFSPNATSPDDLPDDLPNDLSDPLADEDFIHSAVAHTFSPENNGTLAAVTPAADLPPVSPMEWETENPFSFIDDPLTAYADVDDIDIDLDADYLSTGSLEQLKSLPLDPSPASAQSADAFQSELPTLEDDTLFIRDDFANPEETVTGRQPLFVDSSAQPIGPDRTSVHTKSGEVSSSEVSGDEVSSVDQVDPDQVANGASVIAPAVLQSHADFLDEFDEFDDLGNLTAFDSSDASDEPEESSGMPAIDAPNLSVPLSAVGNPDHSERTEPENSLAEAAPAAIAAPSNQPRPKPEVSVKQGWFAAWDNASLASKKWLIAGITGMLSAVAVAAVDAAIVTALPRENRITVWPGNTLAGLAMSATAGVTSFGAASVLAGLLTRQVRRTSDDLHTQFESIGQNEFSAKATVYATDELGQLAAGFNQMAAAVLTTTQDLERKAEHQKQAKEKLQRQVICLLEDVEGAARGDLTVEAEVTPDMLGAVSASFNLTIQSLREIVQQVKRAARQVTKSATENEMFARSLSLDALRQAEELSVALNAVQVMSDSIQRVAESASEAEDVAQLASTTALKGGEAVEQTVTGILEIRATVAETTRKVKRLAESSQEISRIVALIAQIASRTNLLALNASIEAAKAGDAGRGFTIVADEIRQLAARAARASKEIERLVLQIQGETSSVMIAMEEGTQQVIEGTRLAERAKRSLEDIIQVSNRIDALVRSITSDTIEQTDTSRTVAQVMQSVELTAQETSQEAQRVSTSLQSLVGVARDLSTSVQQFRVEKV
jgi:twitching motility protein PilJ